MGSGVSQNFFDLFIERSRHFESIAVGIRRRVTQRVNDSDDPRPECEAPKWPTYFKATPRGVYRQRL
jgi:hypothetical protein